MATYNLTAAQLDNVLSAVGPTYQTDITNALSAAGLFPAAGQTIAAEIVNNSNAGGANIYNLTAGQELFIEQGAGGSSSAYMIDYVITPQDAVISLTGASYTQLTVVGGTSNTILAGDGDFLTVMGDGNDVIYGGTGEFQLLNAQGHDTLIGGGTNVLVSYESNNTLYGGLSGSASDTLLSVAGSGTHTLMKAYDGNNYLLGQSGSDTLLGGTGSDTLIAGLASTAADTLYAGTGANYLQVLDGDNNLFSLGGTDTLIGGLGDDTLYGGGQSWLIAGAGGSVLIGKGADSLLSSTGDDYLEGGTLFYSGLGGNDTVVGSASNDTFYSGLGGNDTIYGGGGSDTLLFYNYTSAEVTVTVNGDGSTLYAFGAGDDAKTTLVYNVDTVYFKTPTV